MPEFDHYPAESWLQIAAQAKKESDPGKLLELVQTLCEALEQIRLERTRKLPSKSASA